ncbi:aspartyl protease family protein [Qipengyuania sp. JC766]|uniref:aspartyl protease family protein n=1 Tax=Qipengyuania sp. JC766 TaxID=3232139 RepID=UPI003457E618
MKRWSLIALCALCAATNGVAEDDGNANPVTPSPPATLAEAAPDFHVIESTPDRIDRMTVPVTIAGGGPYRFMVDTGSQATVVTRRIVDELALESVGRATVVGMASRADVELVRVEGLSFADRTFDDIHAPLLEQGHIGADGILGLDSLQGLRVLIDFRAETIAVGDPEVLGASRGYEIVVRARRKLGRLIITDARVDGVRASVIVDTGAQGSIGNLALKRRLRARELAEVEATDVNGGKIRGKRDYVRSFRIGRMHLNNLPIAFTDAPAFDALGLNDRPALVLGMRDLRLFDRIAIDFDSRRVLFDLPEEVASPGPAMRQLSPTRIGT